MRIQIAGKLLVLSLTSAERGKTRLLVAGTSSRSPPTSLLYYSLSEAVSSHFGGYIFVMIQYISDTVSGVLVED